jgi:hypothetical protein
MKKLLLLISVFFAIGAAAQQKTTAPVSGKPGALGADYPKYLNASRDPEDPSGEHGLFERKQSQR